MLTDEERSALMADVESDRTVHQKTFDARPCRGCTMDDLVPDLFLVSYLPAAVERDVLEENRRSRDAQMASLRFYDLAADCPTNAGALLFAKDPCAGFPAPTCTLSAGQGRPWRPIR